MVICRSSIFEFSVGKDMKKQVLMKGGGSGEGSGTFMSNPDCQGTEN